MTDNGVILETRSLTRELEINGERRRIVDDISIQLKRGGIYSILGPSGAGKSSLLRLLNRLDEPTSGEVLVEGEPYRDISPCELRRRIGYLFQVPYLFPGTVEANLHYANESLTDEQIATLLAQVSLSTDKKDQKGESLSVGEGQRVALARLLATEPKLLLLDEPTASLDPAHTQKIEHTVQRLAHDDGLTVVMVSHNPDQAARMGGEGFLVVAGQLVEQGEARQLVENPTTDLGRRYRDRELT